MAFGALLSAIDYRPEGSCGVVREAPGRFELPNGGFAVLSELLRLVAYVCIWSRSQRFRRRPFAYGCICLHLVAAKPSQEPSQRFAALVPHLRLQLLEEVLDEDQLATPTTSDH